MKKQTKTLLFIAAGIGVVWYLEEHKKGNNPLNTLKSSLVPAPAKALPKAIAPKALPAPAGAAKPNIAQLTHIETLPQIALNNTTVKGAANYSYSASVPNNIGTLQIKPTSKDPHASVKVNGMPVASGALSKPIALAPGKTTITIVVTAQDGRTSKAYIIGVNRAAASLANPPSKLPIKVSPLPNPATVKKVSGLVFDE
jgi:hypothetical protein